MNQITARMMFQWRVMSLAPAAPATVPNTTTLEREALLDIG